MWHYKEISSFFQTKLYKVKILIVLLEAILKVQLHDAIIRFTEFGASVPYRPPEDTAFSVARFIAASGSFVNYYMVHIPQI